jgi:hypothetical protein
MTQWLSSRNTLIVLQCAELVSCVAVIIFYTELALSYSLIKEKERKHFPKSVKSQSHYGLKNTLLKG